MSTTYTSTIEVNVWKEHTCISCGTKYRYLFKRTKEGQGGTPDAASANAHNAVIKALENEVDMQPCPGCGTYQPDMIASQRSDRHWWTFWLSIPVLLLVLILILSDVISYPTGALTLATLAGVALLCHLVYDMFNPNANLDANQRLGKDREEAGDLWVPKQPKGEGGTEAGNGLNFGHTVGFTMLVAGVLAFLVPMLWLMITGGTSNRNWNPEVVGPGDEAYVYFDTRLKGCVKNLWTATPRVTVLNWAELGIPGPAPTLAARSNNSSWGAGTITIGKGDTKDGSPLLWSYVTLPADERLVNKKLQLKIDMSVHFPKLQNSNSYIPVTENHSYNTTVTLSGLKAGGTYRMIWWLTVLSGLVLSTVGAIVLPMASNAYGKRAHKTEIFAPDEPTGMSSGSDSLPDDDDSPPPSRRDDDRYRQE